MFPPYSTSEKKKRLAVTTTAAAAFLLLFLLLHLFFFHFRLPLEHRATGYPALKCVLVCWGHNYRLTDTYLYSYRFPDMFI